MTARQTAQHTDQGGSTVASFAAAAAAAAAPAHTVAAASSFAVASMVASTAAEQLQSLAATDFAAGQRCIDLVATNAAALRALAISWFNAEQNIVARLALLQIVALVRQYILTHPRPVEPDDKQLKEMESAVKNHGT